ncbi:LutB/LldF family L-lactate oxidation iron-sulfur protein [Hyphomicrobium sp. D-2]|uniref:LutB/LldF family L-lactate oxidation iron-sulfur protein n=1 Tax=Hyphomicrobium sp. D-2 TaxID=3041621 RepID=UPI002454229B|nr:LutB/LldF family L-lactate oxidation iron-sulfur protein [Hyphomicrobium sp. D-2]MDH4982243.1 LutB/LldF family L-lactate oxidation iron-sulfur protein [Hyphomicrobium sp. D-2]
MTARTQFDADIDTALADAPLQRALADVPAGFVAGRRRAREELLEFEPLRRVARDIRDHALAHLDLYLEAFESNATKAGSRVHWAASGDDACRIVLDICRAAGARTITKSKSMVSEEIELRERLQDAEFDVVETDLGEYLVQIRNEKPSHIIAPAIHMRAEDVADVFRRQHGHLAPDRKLDTPEEMIAEARGILRDKFLSADVGITGANFLVAESGSAIIVTNEGNADLTMSLPKVHVILTSIDKVVPTFSDAWPLLRLLARSATGQAFTAYTTIVTGPRRPDDPDGPEQCHIILLDNGRTELLASEMRPVLRCIRCGACMNHCPVYCSIGGHAYNSVYPGPIGAALSPALAGAEQAAHLAEASTFCGRCEQVCPVEIPLVSVMRQWRSLALEQPRSRRARVMLHTWARLAQHPRIYRWCAGIAARSLKWLAGSGARIRRLPFLHAWTDYRDLAAPQGGTFQQQWAQREHKRAQRDRADVSAARARKSDSVP